MTTGFFPPTTVSGNPSPSSIPRCGQCGLYRDCLSPRMKPTGEGQRGVLIVAEAPGGDEDKKGIQLVGKAGKRLRSELGRLGWDLDRDCWKDNVVICRPPNNDMKDTYIECCQPNLNKTIEKLKPEVIILLGLSAVKSLIGQDWHKGIGELGTWVGWQIPSQRLNAWICPTYHPSYLERKTDPVLDLWFRKHLEEALKLNGSPYTRLDGLDWDADVEVFYEPVEAANAIRCMIGSKPVAPDFETNRLKPDHWDARIVSCALSNGETTIAYPWVGEAIEATSEFLKSDTPKFGWNIKFEQRWSQRILGHCVRNWIWDGMQGTHILDNRKKITSAKFQAYVQLGLTPYDSVVGPLLKAENSNAQNKIHEVDLKTLLIYNGIDALVEHKIAKLQMKEMGISDA